jgi:hypothetical protein
MPLATHSESHFLYPYKQNSIVLYPLSLAFLVVETLILLTIASCFTLTDYMAAQFCFHVELAQYCIVDVPGLNLDICFQNDHLSIGAKEVREKITAWERMDLHLAADEISSCYQTHDYKPRVNSYPQAPLTLFSPLLRRLCVISSACALRPIAQTFTHAFFICMSQALTLRTVTGQRVAPVKSCEKCCGAAFKVSNTSRYGGANLRN